ncbi:MAG: MmgE/PrpD family protein [Pseudolabrys sp.]|nr:MmgE/PrpD family protein [Pseudolabrys sp.]
MSLTHEIAKRVAVAGGEPAPPEAEDLILRGIADCIGVMLAGWNEPVSRTARQFAGTSDERNPFDLGVPAPAAALVYGAAAHALDYDDTGMAAHPSALLLPAVLAESLELKASGRAMLTAYLAGYEAWAELWRREPDHHHAKGWHPTAVFGAVAAAAASASLRRASLATTQTALGIAASFAAGLVGNFGTMTKPFQVGRAAQNGLQAVRLAEIGLTASPDILEHDLGFLAAFSPKGRADRDAPLSPDYGHHILQHGLNIKLYPVCYALHRTIDAMLSLRNKPGFDPAAIARVEVEIGATQNRMLRHHAPQNSLDAKFSLEFAMAAAAIEGRVGMNELSDAFVKRPDIQALFKKVSSNNISETDPNDPVHSPYDRVVVTLTDGARHDSGKVTHPVGHFRKPVGMDRLRTKFIDCTLGMISRAEADSLFNAIQKLPSLPDVSRLRALLPSAARKAS